MCPELSVSQAEYPPDGLQIPHAVHRIRLQITSFRPLVPGVDVEDFRPIRAMPAQTPPGCCRPWSPRTDNPCCRTHPIGTSADWSPIPWSRWDDTAARDPRRRLASTAQPVRQPRSILSPGTFSAERCEPTRMRSRCRIPKRAATRADSRHSSRWEGSSRPTRPHSGATRDVRSSWPRRGTAAARPSLHRSRPDPPRA